jgi:hypothetical protein
MMIQEGHDETRKELPSEYSARQILNTWTVAEGNYRDSDPEAVPARSSTPPPPPYGCGKPRWWARTGIKSVSIF